MHLAGSQHNGVIKWMKAEPIGGTGENTKQNCIVRYIHGASFRALKLVVYLLILALTSSRASAASSSGRWRGLNRVWFRGAFALIVDCTDGSQGHQSALDNIVDDRKKVIDRFLGIDDLNRYW